MQGRGSVIYTIEPKPTDYGGVRFRSQLESCWAKFFDHFNIRWLYEPAKFRFGHHGSYIPDFHLPDLKTWIEIKPDIPHYIEEKSQDLRIIESRLWRLGVKTKEKTVLAVGSGTGLAREAWGEEARRAVNEAAIAVVYDPEMLSQVSRIVAWVECDKCKIINLSSAPPSLTDFPPCQCGGALYPIDTRHTKALLEIFPSWYRVHY